MAHFQKSSVFAMRCQFFCICLFVLFLQTFTFESKLLTLLQRDSNSPRQSRRLDCWPQVYVRALPNKMFSGQNIQKLFENFFLFRLFLHLKIILISTFDHVYAAFSHLQDSPQQHDDTDDLNTQRTFASCYTADSKYGLFPASFSLFLYIQYSCQ